MHFDDAIAQALELAHKQRQGVELNRRIELVENLALDDRGRLVMVGLGLHSGIASLVMPSASHCSGESQALTGHGSWPAKGIAGENFLLT